MSHRCCGPGTEYLSFLLCVCCKRRSIVPSGSTRLLRLSNSLIYTGFEYLVTKLFFHTFRTNFVLSVQLAWFSCVNEWKKAIKKAYPKNVSMAIPLKKNLHQLLCHGCIPKIQMRNYKNLTKLTMKIQILKVILMA